MIQGPKTPNRNHSGVSVWVLKKTQHVNLEILPKQKNTNMTHNHNFFLPVNTRRHSELNFIIYSQFVDFLVFRHQKLILIWAEAISQWTEN